MRQTEKINIPSHHDFNPYPPWLAAVLAFFSLAIFDALIGGAISTILRLGGWTEIDQRLNDVYHVNYALVVAATLVWFYSHFKSPAPVLALAVLFLGYVEDTLFYCLVPLFNPAIKMITKGEAFHLASGEMFPERISGWLGWLGRSFSDRNIAFDWGSILVFNAIAIALAAVLFCINCKDSRPLARRNKENPVINKR